MQQVVSFNFYIKRTAYQCQPNLLSMYVKLEKKNWNKIYHVLILK